MNFRKSGVVNDAEEALSPMENLIWITSMHTLVQGATSFCVYAHICTLLRGQ